MIIIVVLQLEDLAKPTARGLALLWCSSTPGRWFHNQSINWCWDEAKYATGYSSFQSLPWGKIIDISSNYVFLSQMSWFPRQILNNPLQEIRCRGLKINYRVEISIICNVDSHKIHNPHCSLTNAYAVVCMIRKIDWTVTSFPYFVRQLIEEPLSAHVNGLPLAELCHWRECKMPYELCDMWVQSVCGRCHVSPNALQPNKQGWGFRLCELTECNG